MGTARSQQPVTMCSIATTDESSTETESDGETSQRFDEISSHAASDLSMLQVDMLRCIAALTPETDADGPKGIEVRDTLARRYGAPINNNRIYPRIAEFVDEGLIDRTDIDGRSHALTLTEKGVEVLQQLVVGTARDLAAIDALAEVCDDE